VRRLLLILAGIAFAWGLIVILTGGVDWRIGGTAVRSRAPDRPFIIGITLLLAQAIAYRQAFARDAARVSDAVRPLLPALALGIAAALAVYAAYFGWFTASGSDAYGYVSQAYLWANGALPSAQTIPIEVPWPSADVSLAPLGYRPGPQPHTIVPTYAPGLPLIMAAASVAGACGPFLVVPAFAAAAVWATFVLGKRTAGATAGFLAAALVAMSPTMLFMALAPMSDVPAAALWTAAACAALGTRRRDVVWCGIFSAVGLLVRPNLAIVPVVFFVHLAAASAGRERVIRPAIYAIPVAAVVVFVGMLNATWYGSPLNSGYGSTAEIFSASSILPNLARYPVWLWRSQSPFVLLALLPLVPPFDRFANRAAVRLCAALFFVTLFSYLVYFSFEEWWYLRFLLPAMPALIVLLAAGLVAMRRQIGEPWGGIVTIAATLVMVTLTTRFSYGHVGPSGIQDGEHRYAEVGAFVWRTLPPNAVVLAVQESGSVRFYGGRMTIRWDLIDRDWTSRAPAELERLGLHPYLVIEDFELAQFRDWFGLAAGSRLPWPLVARMRERGGVSVHDLAAQPGTIAPVSLEPGGTPHCAAPRPIVLQRP
jgi:hypothetical protein